MKKQDLMTAFMIFTDYNAIAVSDILDIHKYLRKKNGVS